MAELWIRIRIRIILVNWIRIRSASNKNPDLHEIKIRIRIRIGIRIRVISRIRIHIKVMRIHNTAGRYLRTDKLTYFYDFSLELCCQVAFCSGTWCSTWMGTWMARSREQTSSSTSLDRKRRATQHFTPVWVHPQIINIDQNPEMEFTKVNLTKMVETFGTWLFTVVYITSDHKFLVDFYCWLFSLSILMKILFYYEFIETRDQTKNPKNPLLPMDFKIFKKIIPQTYV